MLTAISEENVPYQRLFELIALRDATETRAATSVD